MVEKAGSSILLNLMEGMYENIRMHMWQSQVEIEQYLLHNFDCVTTFEVL